jgi:hypothetical protein
MIPLPLSSSSSFARFLTGKGKRKGVAESERYLKSKTEYPHSCLFVFLFSLDGTRHPAKTL